MVVFSTKYNGKFLCLFALKQIVLVIGVFCFVISFITIDLKTTYVYIFWKWLFLTGIG